MGLLVKFHLVTFNIFYFDVTTRFREISNFFPLIHQSFYIHWQFFAIIKRSWLISLKHIKYNQVIFIHQVNNIWPHFLTFRVKSTFKCIICKAQRSFSLSGFSENWTLWSIVFCITPSTLTKFISSKSSLWKYFWQPIMELSHFKAIHSTNFQRSLVSYKLLTMMLISNLTKLFGLEIG